MEGSKFDSKFTTTEIAARVRKDIAAAMKEGSVPKGKYSVKTKYFSGGSSISVRVMHVENPDFVVYKTEGGYTREASDLVKKLESLVNAYNYDESDISSDYFNVRFYEHVDFDYRFASSKTAQEEPTPVATPSEPTADPEPQEAPSKPEETSSPERKPGDFVTAIFPSLNKNGTLEENDRYLDEDHTPTRCKIQKVVRVPASVYDALGDTLLDDNSIWECIGGSEADGFDDVTIEEICSNNVLREKYRKACWTNIVLVTDGKREFAVNTEGHTYARYVGRVVSFER